MTVVVLALARTGGLLASLKIQIPPILMKFKPYVLAIK